MRELNRRGVIGLVGGAAAWPVAARAQQSNLPVVGFLHSGSPEGRASRIAAFRRGLAEGGYVEGQNVAIEYRWAEENYDDFPRSLPISCGTGWRLSPLLSPRQRRWPRRRRQTRSRSCLLSLMIR